MTDANGHADALFLQLPSPPYRDVLRGFAGGFGVSMPSRRGSWGHGDVNQPHLATVYAFSSALAQGRPAAFVDGQAERLDVDDLRERVRRLSPSVIVSPINLPSMHADLGLLRVLKEDTGATVVSTGTVSKVLTGEVLEDGTVDVAVVGDIEQIGPALLGALSRGESVTGMPGTAVTGEDGVTSTQGGELDSLEHLPAPAFDRLPMQNYRTWELGLAKQLFGRQYGGLPQFFPLYLSRGCPYGCSYCPYPLGLGTRHLVKTADQSIEEFAKAAEAGAKHVTLRDQVLPIQSGELERFCKAMKKARLGTKWICEARVGSLDAPTLRLMREAGCMRIHYGVETGDPETFAEEAKRGIGSDAVGPCFEATKEAGIIPAAHFLVGFSHDDWDSVGRTVELIRHLRIANGDCALMTPYPGTSTYREVVERGRLLTDRWEDFTGSEPIVRNDNMSAGELLLARSYILQALLANRRPGIRQRVSALRQAVRYPAIGSIGTFFAVDRAGEQGADGGWIA